MSISQNLIHYLWAVMSSASQSSSLMWDWITIENARVFAGPVATVIASLVAACFARAQWRVADAQKEIAYDKLKLELFEERYAIYVAAKDLIEYILQGGKGEDVAFLRKHYIALDEARFFFDNGRLEGCGLNFETLISDASSTESLVPKRQQGQIGLVEQGRAGPMSGGLPVSQPIRKLTAGRLYLLYPGEPSWTDAKGRAAALNRWCAVIAKEVGRKYETKTARDAAVEFARSHRLSIEHAFERKLVRKDVVANL